MDQKIRHKLTTSGYGVKFNTPPKRIRKSRIAEIEASKAKTEAEAQMTKPQEWPSRVKLSTTQRAALANWLRNNHDIIKHNKVAKTTVASQAQQELGFHITERVIEGIVESNRDLHGLFTTKRSPFSTLLARIKELELRIERIEHLEDKLRSYEEALSRDSGKQPNDGFRKVIRK